jgi:hypothetical protein
VTVDEYYQYIFENTKGLPENAAKEGLSPLDYMRKYGAYIVEPSVYERNMRPLSKKELEGAYINKETGAISKKGKPIGLIFKEKDGGAGGGINSAATGKAVEGFPTPSGKNEFFSQTMIDWKWGEYAIPCYIKSHIHEENMDRSKGEYPLVPTFRLPTLIHSRSGNAKWLYVAGQPPP